MVSPDNYTVGWVCALPVEVAAAKALLDHVHGELPADLSSDDPNSYVLGNIQGHNIVLAHPPFGSSEATSTAAVDAQMRARFKSIRFSLMVGIGGGAPSGKNDIRLGDVVVSKPTSTRPGLMQLDLETKPVGDPDTSKTALRKPSTLLLTAAGKAETIDILGESMISCYIAEIANKDAFTFTRPTANKNVLSDYDCERTSTESADGGCNTCDTNETQYGSPREVQVTRIHYGLVASTTRPMCHATTRDSLAREHGILCFETEASGLIGTDQCLIIRGICDYADSHRCKHWHGYAAAASAAYAKEILLQITEAPTLVSVEADMHAAAATILDALLLTRPEVDRSSLIALKGRRAEGTCEWLIQHPSYREWLSGTDPPLLWISGGPGKGKTMLAIYITEALQPSVASPDYVLLYYFCSSRDRNRNTAVTIMRGIIHQWLTFHPQLVQHIKNYFEGSETTKYTISNFVSLWRLFLILMQQSASRQVLCVLDGLDECEGDSLKQLLDAMGEYISNREEATSAKLKIILLSRPRPQILESKLGHHRRIKLDDADVEIGQDVEKYIFAKVAELATEQSLSEDMLLQVRRTLMAGAEGTFLWVGFVADELKGKSWHKIEQILQRVPKGLGGIYQRLLQQIEAKEKLVPVLQWIVLAARPLTVDELTAATGTTASNDLAATEVMKSQLDSCGLLVKIEGEVVNLVHESAKEFFQSDQVNVERINMFYMNHATHRKLMRACLRIIEESYTSPDGVSDKAVRTTLLPYASLYWPEHFRNVQDISSELSRPFFHPESLVRQRWWEFYWDQEQYGGAPPSFTLLHLAAYFGDISWARSLIHHHGSDRTSHANLVSRKDNYGRTPLFWAATQGHKDMVELLLDHDAQVNSKDRSNLTALHIAITSGHKDIVSVLLDRSASIEGKAIYGDTPLIRAIQANSEEIIEILLQHGARVDGLPNPPGFPALKGPKDPLEERVKQLLGLQEQLFVARYENSSRTVKLGIRTLTLSFYLPPLLKLVKLYLRHSWVGRWEVMHVLQDLVKNGKTDRLRRWAEAFIKFGIPIVESRNAKNLTVMTALSVQIFQVVSTEDLKALLVIGVLVGSAIILAAAQREWREGVDISARTFAQFASLAYHRDAGESLHYGVREFLVDFDRCIWSAKRHENVARTVVLFSTHLAVLETQDELSIQYFSTVIAEYFEKFIGGGYEEQLFNDANRACAQELAAISKDRDSRRLLLFLTAITQFAKRSRNKGKDRFLNIPPASCLVLCQGELDVHRWLIAEAVPETMGELLSEQEPGPIQQRIFQALVECLVIGKQYGLTMPVTRREKVKQHVRVVDGADKMLKQFFRS
ncbi:Ankyrin repeat-containing domain protein [Cordyceps fumosorosea ARSEF 2679]|uniref:Ankyrin repeat-containing domain protein n=1 Tax=Cordyceps fumosorosea (strain ARSEF 2679) TaxID=1081104 RepID=A0A162ICJ8_CORFA|nr:Ankyrin repeat-containing domain protein [Cordyceps fumosorosea ARSEF 2679]OAA55165.1 Ankyrin repeat-containing domain protein [Cordyceps fumosorosea ARSEF 2679]